MEDTDAGSDRDWKFALEDFEVDDEEGLEPGSPSTEGVFFVLLGAAVTVASFVVAFLL